MKYRIMLGILFTLLSRRRVCAAELAEKYNVSVRSIYRYAEEMCAAGVPIGFARGANGGIYISDAYKLPKGFLTQEEYARTLDALHAMLQTSDDPALRQAAEKLSAQSKSEKKDLGFSGYIFADGDTWTNERKFAEKLALLERSAEECEAVEIDYIDREGTPSHRVVLPHLLVYKHNFWYLYAFCRNRDAFRLFKVGRMRTIVCTGETFERMPFRREDIPLDFRRTAEIIEARFEIAPEALPFAEEWLGVENVRRERDTIIAEAVVPDDDRLVAQILSAGAGFRVLAPDSLRERVRAAAQNIALLYD